MAKLLLCNVVLYRPNREALAAEYNYRHVEALLDEAGDLMERCLHDFKQYASLDYAWHQFVTELRAEEKQVDLDRQRRRWDVAPEEAAAEEEAAPEAPVEEGAAAAPTSALAAGGEEERAEELPEEEAPEAKPEREEPAVKDRLELRAEAVQRKKDLAAPGQPFALNEQRDLVLRRLCRDYEEAVNCACMAEEGLKKVYGYADVPSSLPSEAEPLSESITNLALWVRNAREWLARYQRQEHHFTRVVSVRSQLNRGMWTQVKHARDNFSFKLHVPSDLFRNYDNCLVRGIAASLVGDVGAVQWTVVVRLPQEATFQRGGESVDVDQSDLAPCMLGRVENRKSARPLDVAGVTSHLNVSPIGRATQGGVWFIELARPSGMNTEAFTHLEDVVLEIALTGIPKGERKWARAAATGTVKIYEAPPEQPETD